MVDLDEVFHSEPPHQNIRCLQIRAKMRRAEGRGSGGVNVFGNQSVTHVRYCYNLRFVFLSVHTRFVLTAKLLIIARMRNLM